MPYKIGADEIRTWGFYLKVVKGSLPKEILENITEFTYEENEEKADELKLTVINLTVELIDSINLDEDIEIEVRFGYIGGTFSKPKIVVIKGFNHNFANGITMDIVAYDKGQYLVAERQKVWEKAEPGYKYSDIAKEIASHYGLKPVVTETKDSKLRVHQGNKSDISFLRELAEKSISKDGKIDYTAYIENNELHFHPRNIEKQALPEFVYTYFDNGCGCILNFSPKNQDEKAKKGGSKTTASTYNMKEKKEESSSADNTTNVNRINLGQDTNLSNQDITITTKTESKPAKHITVPNADEKECETVAKNHHAKVELKSIEASCTMIGDPKLTAKRNIEIHGVGRRYSGVYYCKSLTHRMGSNGYTTELQLNKNAKGKKGINTEKTGGQQVKSAKKDSNGPKPSTKPRDTINLYAGS